MRYRGYDVYSIAPSSSGGSTVGEALNILRTKKLSRLPETEALHDYLDASSLAFADRNAYVGDPAFVDVPLKTLLSRPFARSRACQIGDRALPTPTTPGALDATGCATAPAVGQNDAGTSTSHLVTSDRWGNVVSYTLTIEQTGGSGIVVPGRGFLLNNELTDFTAVYDPKDPNRIEGGKRPRSSMAPTIVLKDGKPAYAIGSPGGATIITTVLQTLVNRIDLGMTLPEAVAAPRASARNTAPPKGSPAGSAGVTAAEPEFIEAYGKQLEALGYVLTPERGLVHPALADRRGRGARVPQGRPGAGRRRARPSRRRGRGGRQAALSGRRSPPAARPAGGAGTMLARTTAGPGDPLRQQKEGHAVADDPAISDERVAQVLGLYARMANRVIGDPVRWLGLDDDPPPSAGFPRKALDALRDRAFGEVTPASPDWGRRPLDERVRWWVRRIGVSAGLAAAVPRVAGALASRVPLQAALGSVGRRPRGVRHRARARGHRPGRVGPAAGQGPAGP